jgi:phosphoglycerate-specific signal transduction histidine kinase
MVATMNHEIRNPLCIANGFLRKAMNNTTDSQIKGELEKVNGALMRINEIVKKIDAITDGKIEYASYAESTKMLNLKN